MAFAMEMSPVSVTLLSDAQRVEGLDRNYALSRRSATEYVCIVSLGRISQSWI